MKTSKKASSIKRDKDKVIASSESPVVLQRKISEKTKLRLFVQAGGRCEFEGCNKDLLRHYLTQAKGNYGDIAHIVAFKRGGPRGNYVISPEYIHDDQNLMLLCLECHRLIDEYPEKYDVRILKEYKRRHEKHISHVTSLGPEKATAIIQLKARVDGQAVDIPTGQITDAIYPRYPVDIPGVVIDLTQISDGGPEYYEVAKREIRKRIERIYESGSTVGKSHHISVFALAPIPMLVYLGSLLSNKIDVDVYQRHRKPENWEWKRKGKPVEYVFNLLQRRENRKNVALVISLSGTIRVEDLPPHIRSDYTLYEITVLGRAPNPYILNLREDLDRFRIKYQESLRKIQHDHGNLDEINLFPAIPAPVAVFCGRELLSKVDPDLLVYDYYRARGGFALALRVERNEK